MALGGRRLSCCTRLDGARRRGYVRPPAPGVVASRSPRSVCSRAPRNPISSWKWRSPMLVESVLEYQRVWTDGLNRGDVSAADAVFAPDCVVHITGVVAPLRGIGAWKELVAG